MTLNALLIAAGVLVLLEVVILLVLMVTQAKQRRIYKRILAGRDPDLLEEAVRVELYAQITSEYEATMYRQVELACIAFLLPGLASWCIITKKDSPPLLYTLPVAFLFWFVVVWVVGTLWS